ncbi:MAG: hypothetical protein JWO07_761 [Candidatus Saccharibacteria bacterium]|nr:hypothetical protein [Candidatus Saccharibacteria bacterium]
MYHKHKSTSGFTIVELLMAMAFVSILLIVITLTVIQISNIYNKGLTMRAVNQSGTAISADVRQTLSQSHPFDTSTSFFMQTSNGGATTNIGDAVAGRLCTGTYTYVWNLGKAKTPVNVYNSSDKQIGFIRVRDNGAQYCADLGSKIDSSNSADAREFLSTDTAELAVQSFTVSKLADDTPIGQALYRIVFELGTNNQDALQQEQHIDTIDTSCRPPSDASSLQDYCAVNQFDFTAQAGNRGGQ